MAPCFSVIVPVYKVEPYLRECVDSILNQTFSDYELILVDDGSPDTCPAICDEYAAQDDRIRVIHKTNGGLAAARKSGLDIARAEYVCFIDSDDRAKPEWLETIKRCIDSTDRPDMILYGFVWDYETRMEDAPPTPAPGYYDKARLESEIYPRMLYDRTQPFFDKLICSYVCMKCAKRELWLKHYVDDPRITIFEDGAMVYECLYHAQSVYICSDCLYLYRQREQSILNRYQPKYIYNLSLILDYVHNHLGVLSPDIDLQLNAYITMRTILAILQEFTSGHGLKSAASNVRQEMNQTGLARKLRLNGLPLHIKVFVLLLKLHLYLPAAWITKLRLAPTAN